MKVFCTGASLVVLALAAGCPRQVSACTLIAVGRNATADGSVMVAQTDAAPDSRVRVVPGRSHEPGEMAPVYWGIQDATRPVDDLGEVLGTIPQVERTFAYLHSAYSHLNEHQLAIGESTIVQRPELDLERDEGEQIMTIEQAQIFALQRCTTAREAVRLIGELVTTYGFLPSIGGPEALIIADPEEVWVLEVMAVGPGWQRASGRPGAIWAAQRLADDHATVIPNWSIIREIDPDDGERFMVSANAVSEAVERGWYDPATGRPFSWRDAYTPVAQEFATGRFWLFYSTFTPNLRDWPDRSLGDPPDPSRGLDQYFQYVEPLDLYPFSAAPERKISLGDLIAFQRSTFEGTIYDLTGGPQWLVPGEDGRLVKSPLATPFPSRDLRTLLQLTNRRPVARHRGHYGMVVQLRGWLPDAVGGVSWVYQDNPYFSPYVPIYAGIEQTAECYRTYDPESFSERSARWAIDFVDNLAGLRFQDMALEVRAVRDPFEARLLAEQEEVVETATRLLAQSPDAARDYLTRYTEQAMDEVLAMFTELRGTLITKYTNNRE